MEIVESNVPMHMVATDILGEFPTSTFWSSQTALRSGPNVSLCPIWKPKQWQG